MAHKSLFSVDVSALWFRPMVFRVSAAALGLALVALPALPSWPQSMSLDSVDVAHSQSLDDVEQATSGTPGGSRLAVSESLDSVPAAQAESLDSGAIDHGDFARGYRRGSVRGPQQRPSDLAAHALFAAFGPAILNAPRREPGGLAVVPKCQTAASSCGRSKRQNGDRSLRRFALSRRTSAGDPRPVGRRARRGTPALQRGSLSDEGFSVCSRALRRSTRRSSAVSNRLNSDQLFEDDSGRSRGRVLSGAVFNEELEFGKLLPVLFPFSLDHSATGHGLIR